MRGITKRESDYFCRKPLYSTRAAGPKTTSTSCQHPPAGKKRQFYNPSNRKNFHTLFFPLSRSSSTFGVYRRRERKDIAGEEVQCRTHACLQERTSGQRAPNKLLNAKTAPRNIKLYLEPRPPARGPPDDAKKQISRRLHTESWNQQAEEVEPQRPCWHGCVTAPLDSGKVPSPRSSGSAPCGSVAHRRFSPVRFCWTRSISTALRGRAVFPC